MLVMMDTFSERVRVFVEDFLLRLQNRRPLRLSLNSIGSYAKNPLLPPPPPRPLPSPTDHAGTAGKRYIFSGNT